MVRVKCNSEDGKCWYIYIYIYRVFRGGGLSHFGGPNSVPYSFSISYLAVWPNKLPKSTIATCSPAFGQTKAWKKLESLSVQQKVGIPVKYLLPRRKFMWGCLPRMGQIPSNSCSSSMLIIILPTEKARKGCPKKTNHVQLCSIPLFLSVPSTWWSVAVCQSGSWSAQAGEEGTSSHSQTRAQVETCQLHPSSCTRSNKMAVCHFNLKIGSFFEKDSVVRSFMHILGRVAVARAQKTHY